MLGHRPLRRLKRSLHRSGCAHSIPSSLRARLVDSSACPSCQINRLVRDIRDVQKGLKMRGGIFASKEKVVEEKTRAIPGNQAKRHWAWVRKWRKTKIKIESLLREFEDMAEKMAVEKEWSGVEMIREALREWEEVKEEMSDVPSYESVKEAERDGKPNEVDHFKNRQEGGANEVSRHLAQATRTKDHDGDRREEGEMDHADLHTHKTAAALSVIINDIQLQDIQVDDIQTSKSDISGNGASNAVILRPALRTRTPSLVTQPSTISSRPSVAFVSFTTHVPNLRPSLPYEFSQPTCHPHNPYTSSETSRTKRRFLRRSFFYAPGTWSSPEGCRKADTSFLRVSWEQLQRVCEAEMKLSNLTSPEGLNLGSWAWVFRWWCKELRGKENIQARFLDAAM